MLQCRAIPIFETQVGMPNERSLGISPTGFGSILNVMKALASVLHDAPMPVKCAQLMN